MADPAAKLVDELRSLLDEVTILSISSDYDLTKPQEFAAAREVLLTISKNVEAEEATGFNPSGLGVDDVVDINAANSGVDADAANVAEGDIKSNSGLTTTTESSQPLSLSSATSSKSSGQDTPDLFQINVFDTLSDEDKEKQLAQMFTSLKPIDIRLTLKKLRGDASLAMDELLNLQWLEETGQRPKGVDAFYVSDGEPSSKKKKAKKKKKGAKALASPEPKSPGVLEQNMFIDGEHEKNIQFIAERLHQPVQDVTNIYYKRNASLGATVVEIINNYIALGIQASDADLLADVEEQARKYSWVPREHISGIFDICQSHRYALDLVGILGDYYEKPPYLKFDVSYSAIASKSEPAVFSTGNVNDPEAQFMTPRSPASIVRKRELSRPVSFSGASASSRDIATARDHSLTSAASAFRKGSSNPLFRQAGAYYASRARELASEHRQAISVETGYKVGQSATEDSIDLHGATVQDGVNLALDHVWKWWESLGEERTRKAKEGFTVITGMGRHNADGKSPLRINVFKALVADGWKIEVLTARYRITGRRRS